MCLCVLWGGGGVLNVDPFMYVTVAYTIKFTMYLLVYNYTRIISMCV